jgi:hypothetical protein
MVFLFVCSAVLPICNAQISTPQANGEKTSPELPINKVKHTNNDDEAFFDFAIIWGPFEVKFWSSLFHHVVVYNRAPWYNHTMNVIGYQSWEGGKWVVKKSCWIECNYLHVGIVGRNWLFVIGWGSVAAF